MVSSFPVPDKAREDAVAEKEMEVVMNIITSIRNIRGEMQIPPSRKLAVLISVPDKQTKEHCRSGK